MYIRNGMPVNINASVELDGMQYPAGWFHNEQNRDALGITDDGEPELVEDISSLKAAKNEQINQWRAAANQSFFTYMGKEISCDSLSRSDIDGVANSIGLSGGFPVGFPMAWKALDNSYISLPDVDAFKAMYAAMTAKGSANFAHAQGLKTALASATTIEEVEAITW